MKTLPENAVIRSDDLKSFVLDAVSDRLIYYDENMNILWANRTAGESAGLAPSQMVGQKCYEVWHRRAEPCPGCPVAETLATGEPKAGEIYTTDGQILFVRGYPLVDDNGDLKGVAEITADITQRKRVEEAFSWEVKVSSAIGELSRELFSQAAFEEIPSLILEQAKQLTDSAFGFVGYIDPQTGFLVSPTLTRDIWDSCNVKNKDIIFEKVGGLVGWVLENRKPLLTNDPSKDPRAKGIPTGHIPIHRFLSAPVLIDGTTAGVICLANASGDYIERDITFVMRLAGLYAIAMQRKMADEAFQESEQRYRMIFNSVNDAIIVHGLSTDGTFGKITDVNDIACQRLGYTREELLRLTPADYNDSKVDMLRLIQQLIKHRHNVFERVHVTKDGRRIPVEINSHLFELKGELVAFSVVRDVSERKKAQEELQKAKDELEAKVAERTAELEKINEQLRVELAERRRAEEALRKSEAGLANAQRIASLGSWDWNIDKDEVHWSDQVYHIIGLSPKETSPNHDVYKSLIHPGDRDMVHNAVHQTLQKGVPYSIDHRIIKPDGKTRIVHVQAEAIFDDRDNVVHMSGTIQDITHRKLTEANLEAARQRLLDIIEFLPDATLVVDRNKEVIAWNMAMENLTGVRKEDIIGKSDFAHVVPFYGLTSPTLVDLIFSDNEEIKLKYGHVEKKGNTLFAEGVAPLIAEGDEAFLELLASPLYDSCGTLAGAIETIRDVSGRKRMEKQLQHLATHDFLTDVPNRYSLEENLKRVVEKARHGKDSALLFVDLDNFKLVNDTLGHAAGDQLLITLTNVLRENLREGDLLFRFGGDEFAVLLEGTPVKDAETLAEKLRRVVDENVLCLSMYQTCFNLTISVGIVIIDGKEDYRKLLALADTALFTAKERGRNRIAFLQPDEDVMVRLAEINHLVGLIKKALKEDTFALFFQPVVRIADGKIMHHEMLLGLQEQSGELIMPGRFIPVAERFGLMSQIDRWVVRAALNTLYKFDQLRLFVNLSGASLGEESLLELIETNIRTSNLDPSRIGFEITETVAVKDLVRAERWIRRVKRLGCSFALDDFGKGFSSFAYLRMLPVDYLKIDGSFIRNLDKDPTHRALVGAMNDVAHTLGKKTIAEFVENQDVLKILLEMKVEFGQGYYLGKPGYSPVCTCPRG